MYINIICYVYPGVHLSGVGVVYVADNHVKYVAVGSVQNSQVRALLELLSPTEMIVATDKFFSSEHTRVAVPSSVTRFRIAKPGWDRLKVPLDIDGKLTHGVYVHNVYKMLFRDIISRNVNINSWKVEKFDRDWVIAHAPSRRKSGKR